MRTGFTGLGAMGAPMATNIHAAGYLHTVWNRTASRARALADELGCAVAGSPATLAAECDLVVVCVAADADLLEVVDALAPGLAPGKVVVDCSTVSAATAVSAARRVQQQGAAFMDAPVSGGTEGARLGKLSMMAGGEAEVLERCRPVLEAMAARIVHMGPVGNGQATKAVNQIMAAGINQAVSEGMAFASAQGLPLERVIEALGSGAASSWFLHNRGPYMAAGEYPPGFKVALHDKDLAIAQAMAEARGVALPVIEMTRLHYRRLVAAGYGEEDISALHRLKRDMFDNPAHPPVERQQDGKDT